MEYTYIYIYYICIYIYIYPVNKNRWKRLSLFGLIYLGMTCALILNSVGLPVPTHQEGSKNSTLTKSQWNIHLDTEISTQKEEFISKSTFLRELVVTGGGVIKTSSLKNFWWNLFFEWVVPVEKTLMLNVPYPWLGFYVSDFSLSGVYPVSSGTADAPWTLCLRWVSQELLLHRRFATPLTVHRA